MPGLGVGRLSLLAPSAAARCSLRAAGSWSSRRQRRRGLGAPIRAQIAAPLSPKQTALVALGWLGRLPRRCCAHGELSAASQPAYFWSASNGRPTAHHALGAGSWVVAVDGTQAWAAHAIAVIGGRRAQPALSPIPLRPFHGTSC